MMWDTMSEAWRVSFEQAWEAYCQGSVPIGAALVDTTGKVVVKGRNRIYETQAPAGTVHGHKLAHAELNCLLQLQGQDLSEVRSYTLYTTVEPCPLCFGALVMSNVRNLRYAARDAWAGSADLIRANHYLRSKPLRFDGPEPVLGEVAALLHSVYVLERVAKRGKESELIAAWAIDYPKGVALARIWFENNTLSQGRILGWTAEKVFGTIVAELDQDQTQSQESV